MHSLALWVGFHVFIALLLICEWSFFKRLTSRRAWVLSGVSIALALIFNGFVWAFRGAPCALQFFTAYVVEKSLSVDNLLVFLFLLQDLTQQQQRKVLFWGIWGAIVFRLLFILLGLQLLSSVQWMTYVLGLLLCFTAVRFLLQKEQKIPAFLQRLFAFLPLSKDKTSLQFFVGEGKGLKATLLFSILLLVEGADLLFAIDSIPAVLALTKDAFIAYTSNVFAILGLRSLYFALCPYLKKLHTLRYGLAAILFFVGAKILIAPFYEIPLFLSLLVILAILLLNLSCQRHN